LSYAWRDLTIGASWRYIDSMIRLNTDPVFRVPHVDYFDLNAGYEFSAGLLEGLEMRGGHRECDGQRSTDSSEHARA
jgi:hypothetical protein